VDYRVTVSYAADVDRALQIFADVLKDVAQDPKWGKLISEPPKVLGVDAISAQGATLRAQLRTSPGTMFEMSREINRRMLQAFVQQGIPLAIPTNRVGQDGAQVSPPSAATAQPKP
jgi:small conductance mechanosensitive channel